MFHNLPVYIPNSRVCHMEQYHCCKYRWHCRLYSKCSKVTLPTVCTRDCPRCTFTGCSLSAEKRQLNPVYIHGVIQGNRLDLNLETRLMAEKLAHRKRHFTLYQYYNTIFGDLVERRRRNARNRYWADPERAREVQRNYYRKTHPTSVQSVPEKYLPECGLNCSSRQYADCILPENWLKQAKSRKFYQENPEYFKQYRQQNKDKRSAYNKEWYQKNKIEKLKKQRAEYDRKYRDSHWDKEREKHHRYYQRHRDEINSKKRAKRAEKR